MADAVSLLKREKFPVLREFRLPSQTGSGAGGAGLRLLRPVIACFSKTESWNINHLILFFFDSARARARGSAGKRRSSARPSLSLPLTRAAWAR
jgi:hypothetical protein